MFISNSPAGNYLFACLPIHESISSWLLLFFCKIGINPLYIQQDIIVVESINNLDQLWTIILYSNESNLSSLNLVISEFNRSYKLFFPHWLQWSILRVSIFWLLKRRILVTALRGSRSTLNAESGFCPFWALARTSSTAASLCTLPRKSSCPTSSLASRQPLGCAELSKLLARYSNVT